MIAERARRDAVVDYANRLHARGWVANHDGNLTVRLGEDRFLATPTATSKAAVTRDNLLVVDGDGARVSGESKPFGEIGLHLTVYKNRPEVQAVVHAHPPCATGLACAGSRLLERPFIAEAVVSLGPTIPTVPFAAPGAPACAALAPFTLEHDAVLIANHGVMTWGVDLEQAYLRLELVEHLARIALEAERAGGVRPLPESALPALLESRRKAGLGPKTTAPTQKPVVACAPAPHSDVPTIAPGRPSSTVIPSPSADLARIIREELARALKG